MPTSNKKSAKSQQDGSKKKASLKDEVVKSRSPRRKNYVLDLRIHSPASLGYLGIDGIDTAPAMVRLAKVKGLDIIAVTDFHTGDFIDRVIAAAEGTKLTVLPGVSLRCSVGKCDDVVLVCLFHEEYRASDVEKFLADLNIPKEHIGDENYILDTPFEKILEAIENHRGIAIPSRMDKTPHRMNTIPMLVEEFGFRTFDLAYGDSAQFFKSRWPKTSFNLYSFSSASALAQVGSRNAKVKLPTPTFASLKDIAARAL